MSVIKIRSEVAGFLLNVQLWLEGHEIGLSYDGDKAYQSTDVIDVKDGKLNILLHLQAVSGTDWAFAIVELEPNQKNLYATKGTIGPNGNSLIADFVNVP